MREKKKASVQEVRLNQASFKNKAFSPTLVNFFFGRNGAGKSTIANVIRYNSKDITWENGNPHDCLVLLYNQKFVSDNFRNKDANQGKKIKGVFLVDKDNVQKQDEIAAKEQELHDVKAKQKELQEANNLEESNKSNLLPTLTNACRKTDDFIKSLPKNSTTGITRSDGRVRALLNFTGTPKQIANEKEFVEQANKVFDSTLNPYDSLIIPNGLHNYRNIPGADLLEKVIRSSSSSEFATFMTKIKATEWVKHGYEAFLHHEGNEAGVCPFCQKTKIEEFETELANSFDEDYKSDMYTLNQFRSAYISELNRVLNAFQSNTSSKFPGFKKDKYDTLLSELSDKIRINDNLIESKIRQPETIVKLGDVDDIIYRLTDYIDTVNFMIRDNNDTVDRRDILQDQYIDDIKAYLAYMLKADIDIYNKEEKRISNAIKVNKQQIDALQNDIDRINGELTVLRSSGVSTQKAMTGINNMLKECCFQGFSIEPVPGEDDVYMVKRPGETAPAEGLSEGELNFLAFLYFYQIVRGNLDKDDINNKKKVIVIDDPVTSMDSSSLFMVGALVREMIKVCTNSATLKNSGFEGEYIDQIFILTHNVLFHREVTLGQDRDELYDSVSFYLVNKVKSESSVELCYTDLPGSNGLQTNRNPVRGTYVTLWAEYRNAHTPTDVMHQIRLILEHYFVQLCGFDSNDLYSVLLEDEENKKKFYVFDTNGTIIDDSDYIRASQLLRMFHSSATLTDDGQYYVPDTDDPDKYRSILKKIFDVLDHTRHYDLMMKSTDCLVGSETGRV